MTWTRSTNLKGPSMLRLARLPAALSTDSDTSWLTLFSTVRQQRKLEDQKRMSLDSIHRRAI